MRSVLADLRHGLRLLWRSPLFTVVASASLALGIGANTAIFTLVNTLLLTPLPVRDPGELVAIFTSDFSGPAFGASSYADAEDFAREAPALAGVAVGRLEALSLSGTGETRRVFAEIVNPSYFDVLGVSATAGRLFSAAPGPAASTPRAEMTSRDAGTVVISHRFWTRQLGRAPDAIGRQLILNGQAFTIVGVADARFQGLMRGLGLDLWVPATELPRLLPDSRMATSRGSRGFAVLGRLATGATPTQAGTQLNVLARRLQQQFPDNWTDVTRQVRRVTVLPEQAARVPPGAGTAVTAFLGILLGIVGIVLLVGCANVAGLLVGRAAARRREIAVRLALGAGRGRLVRQLLTESAVLAIVGGLLGLLVAQWTLTLLSSLQPPLPVPVALDLSLDGRVLAFAMIVSLGSGLLFGLAPALQTTRVPLLPALRNDLLTVAAGRRLTLRNGLVVGQVALALILLVVGGLFIRGVQRAYGIDTGFDTRNVVTFSVDPSMLGYGREKTRLVYAGLLERLRAVPGVNAVAVARVVPLSLGTGRRGMRPEGYEPRPGEDMEEPFNIVSPDYFRTMGMRIVAGRDFTDADRAGREMVIIVNQAFGERYWPGQDPLLKRVTTGDGGSRRVVGVVANAKYFSLSEAPRATMFLAFDQESSDEATLHVRGRGPTEALVGPIRDAVRSVDPSLPILTLATLEEQTSLSLLPQRIAIGLLGAFGGLALMMAIIGLYGVLANAVVQRTREIGIRVALGATSREVVGLVLREGLTLAGTGALIGLVAAWAASRLVTAFLHGLSPLDPISYAGGLLLMGAAAVVAIWAPARKAATVDPVVALRYE